MGVSKIDPASRVDWVLHQHPPIRSLTFRKSIVNIALIPRCHFTNLLRLGEAITRALRDWMSKSIYRWFSVKFPNGSLFMKKLGVFRRESDTLYDIQTLIVVLLWKIRVKPVDYVVIRRKPTFHFYHSFSLCSSSCRQNRRAIKQKRKIPTWSFNLEML
mgnify:CR=1 FL=1